MHSAVFASDALHNHIAPPSVSSHKGERIRHAARSLGWSITRTRDLWYNDGRYKPSPDEIVDIEAVSGLTYAKQELDEIEVLISRADNLLHGADPGFSRPFLNAVREIASLAYRAGTQRRGTNQ